MGTIPVIDIAPLVTGSLEQAQTVATALGRACRDVGFFYVIGHGIPPTLRTRVFEHSAAFFTGPASVREAASFTGAGGNRGYIRLGGEALDPGKPADVKEAFNIGLELAPDDPELVARAPFRAANLWPDTLDFRDTMLEYFNRVWRLGRDLHRGFALDLGLEPDYFEARLNKPIATLRLLHYPPVAAPHIYVSTPHKVVSPAGKDRYSVAFFLDPNPDALVACLPTCTSAERPAKYEPISGSDFLRSRLEPTYASQTA